MTLPGLDGSDKRSDGEAIGRVKAMVADVVGDTSATVFVTELTCTEPGCPPVETAIALLRSGSNRQVKIHKKVVDVSIEDVRSALDGIDADV